MQKLIKKTLIISLILFCILVSVGFTFAENPTDVGDSLSEVDDSSVEVDKIADVNKEVTSVNEDSNNLDNIIADGEGNSSDENNNPSEGGTNSTGENGTSTGGNASSTGNGTDVGGNNTNSTGNGTDVGGNNTNSTGNGTNGTGDEGNSTDVPPHVYSYTELQKEIRNLESGETFYLDGNCIYVDGESYSTGIQINDNIIIVGLNNAYIDGNNTARIMHIGYNQQCTVTLVNLTIKNGYNYYNGGGGILVDAGSTLKLINCTFDNNRADSASGGAINLVEHGTLIADNCKFINNFVKEDGVRKSGMGSAIIAKMGAKITLKNSEFKNNIAHVATVLVVSYDDSKKDKSTLTVDNCLFENNQIDTSGVIYLDEYGAGEIKNSVFRSNKVTSEGGIVELDTCNKAIVKNCLFEKNTGVIGGAIHVKVIKTSERSYVTISDCNFTQNTATQDGGAIFSYYGEVTISHCNFNKNTAEQYGGAVYAKFGTINIKDSKFNDNTAQKYGGAAVFSNMKSTITSSEFNKNIVKNKDGVAGAIMSGSGTFTLTKCDFNENSAYRGGALSLKDSTSTITSCSFIKNKATTDLGGAIYASGGSAKIVGSKFNENSAKTAGAIYFDCPKITLESSSFTKNKASETGGAIFSKNKDATSSKCTYSGNTASKAPIIYGSFHATVVQSTYSGDSVKLKVKISSPWKMSLKQKIKITISGPKTVSSKWVETNSKGEATLIVSSNFNKGKSTMTLLTTTGLGFVKSWTKVKDTATVKAPKKVKKSAKITVTIKNKASKKPIKNTKFKVKVYTGKKYKSVTAKTNAKGVLKIAAKKFSKGKHKIVVTLNNADYKINNQFTIKIK